MSAPLDQQDRIVEINRLCRQGAEGFAAAYTLFAEAGELLNNALDGFTDEDRNAWLAENFNSDPLLAQAARFASDNPVSSPVFRYVGLLLVEAIKRDQAEHGKEARP